MRSYNHASGNQPASTQQKENQMNATNEKTCTCCGCYTYTKYTICDECEDNQAAIERGEFHDPDLLARDNEERSWTFSH